MTRLFSKLFNIRPGEWPRLLYLYLIFFVYITGATWGETIVEAAFLQQVGVEYLPWVFVAVAVASVPVTAIYTAFADRIANTKVALGILGLGLLGVVAGRLLLAEGMDRIAYPLLYLIMFVPLSDIFLVHWYTLTNSFYDTQSAKRIVPILATASRIGGILAGLTMFLLNRWLDPANIITVWASAIIAVMLLIGLMPYLFKEDKATLEQPAEINPDRKTTKSQGRLSYLENIREGYHYVTQSRFLLWMAVSTLLLMMLIPFLEFRTSQILLAELGTAQAISNYTGTLNGLTNLIALPIQLFLLSRIIGWIGVGNANLIFPIGNLAISSALIWRPSLFTAALAYFDRNAFRSTFRNPPDSLLYNAVPLRVKGRARAFIGGLVAPLGGLSGGLLLLLPFASAVWFLSAGILLLAVAYLGSTLVIRKQYSHALIQMLEQEDFSFLLLQEATPLTVTDPATLNSLRKKMEESTSHEFTIFMAKLISQIGGSAAISILSQAAKATTDPRSRAAILDVVVAADYVGEPVRQLYIDFLEDEDGRVRQSAIAGLEELSDPQDKQFLALTAKLLTDPDTEVRARILPTLLRANDPEYQISAIQTLDEYLKHQDPHLRARGVRVLNQTGDPRFIHTLLECLADTADEVRLEAALAVETYLSQKIPPPIISLVLDKMNRLAQDPVERIRQAALTILARIHDPAAYQLMLNGLTDPSPQVRSTAVDVLAQAGKAVIPTVHPALNSANPLLRKMATMALSRINQREFGSLVEAHITGNLLEIYRSYGLLTALDPCSQFPSVAILQSAIREQNQQLLDEIFYLLTAIHGKEAVKIVAESFESETARTRANAVEALEAMTTPQTAKLMAPLFEPGLIPAQLLQLSHETWEMAHPKTVEAIKQLLTNPDDPWFRAVMTLALGEMAATFLPEQPAGPQSRILKIHEVVNQRAAELADPTANEAATPAEPAPEEPKAARPRRANPLDLLAADEPAPPAPEPQPPERQRRSRPADLFGALIGSNSSDKADRTEEAKPRRSRPADLLGAIMEKGQPQPPPEETAAPASPANNGLPFSLAEIETMIETAFADSQIDVRLAARAAKRIMAGSYITSVIQEEGLLLSAIEKIIFLKEVPFFQGMTIDQLKVLANVCEEQLFEEDARIFNAGDPGGALYVVVSGRVGIEQEKRKGSFARLATIEAHSYFGEMNLFDNSPRSDTAIALQDTLTLRLRREPLIALARQYPDLSLELINVLSQRLREANDRVADLTRTRPRELHKLFDKFD
ncbi:MAG: HEAT repeat domain-containing protein [Anaerolineae bacterium]|nr:HEAT repeat domain-containing protein [Anaerolineae bacterium]